MPNVSTHLRKIFFVAVLLLAACAPTPAPSNDTAGAVIIDMRPDAFEPTSVTVETGTKVCFTNNDTEARWPASNIHPTHDIYPEFDPAGPVRAGDTWCFTFDEAGIWKFHDHLYPELIGTVTVQ